jgi:hypothetical protein
MIEQLEIHKLSSPPHPKDLYAPPTTTSLKKIKGGKLVNSLVQVSGHNNSNLDMDYNDVYFHQCVDFIFFLVN